MSNPVWDTPGDRLRYVRTEILHMTQEDFATELGLKRSGVSNIEKGRQGIARSSVERLYARHKINPAWLISGHGSPIDSTAKGGSASPERNVSMGSQATTFKMSNAAVGRLFEPRAFIDCEYEGRHGYVGLVGTKVRLKAARDDALVETELFRLVEEDDLWFAAGDPDGWEFEMMREYFQSGGDRSLSEWMEVLRVLRWIRQDLIQSVASRSDSEVKTA